MENTETTTTQIIVDEYFQLLFALGSTRENGFFIFVVCETAPYLHGTAKYDFV